MSFAPEDRLLIECSRVVLDDVAKSVAARLLQCPLDWNYILDSTIAHGVAPLFYHGLNQLKAVVALHQKVPGQIQEELATLYRRNQFRNQRFYRVIDDVAGEFESNGISVLGLKDVQLAREVYSDLGLRPMGDIDLLIHRADYAGAAKCLINLGFDPLPNADTPFTLKYAWGQHFRRAIDNVWIDLQWNVIQREWDVYHEGNFDFQIEEMWRGARPMALDKNAILVPQPEEMLFHLCLHVEGHHYLELILFCDIAELIKRCSHQFDWSYFITITKKRKAQSSVYYVLFLVQRLFQVELPQTLFEEITPDYFNANLFSPLYESLTELHLSLDQIRSTASPPNEILKDFETIVRKQALAAMQVYREIDTLATEFMHAGGHLVLLHGTPSEKIFPDASLRSFEDIVVLIFDSDLDLMHQVLRARGYLQEKTAKMERYVREWQVSSVDPSLHSIPISMAMHVQVGNNLDVLLRQPSADSISKKEIALESLKAKLANKHELPNIRIQIKLAALSPEELLVYASRHASRQKHERLFELCSLLEIFRNKSNSLDWTKVASIAEQYNIGKPVEQGIAMLSELLGDAQLKARGLKMIETPVHILETARYDLDSWGRYATLTKPFYFVLSLFSIHGTKSRLRYLSKSFFGDPGGKLLLLQLIRELVHGLSARKKPRTVRDFAYWIEP